MNDIVFLLQRRHKKDWNNNVTWVNNGLLIDTLKQVVFLLDNEVIGEVTIVLAVT